MPITSINLDEETKEIAKKVGNFSGFVRECLRRWHAYETGTHIQQESKAVQEGKKCYPRHKKGCCVICWPDGAPHHEDWMYYVDAWKSHPETATQYIEEKAREANIVKAFPIPQQSEFKHSRKSRSTPRGEGVIRRLLRALRSQ